jgi:hypothetical protein
LSVFRGIVRVDDNYTVNIFIVTQTAEVIFFADESGMSTPQSMKAKVKRREAALDRENGRVDRILKDIPCLKSLGEVQLE